MKNMIYFPMLGNGISRVIPLLALSMCASASTVLAEGTGSKVDPFTGAAVSASMDGGGSSDAAYYLVNSDRNFGDAAAVDVGSSNPNNNVTITNGAKVSGRSGRIGFSRSSNGNGATVSGIGSAWRSQSSLTVGGFGSYNLLMIINGGAVSFGDVTIGGENFASGNRVSITGYGSSFASSSGICVGLSGSNNNFTVAGSASASCDTAVIGGDSASSGNGVSISDSGSTWKITGANVPTGDIACLYVGKSGSKNIFEIKDGASVDAARGICIGYGSDANPEFGGQNALIVSGEGSVLTADTSICIGYHGCANLLVIQNGAMVKIDGSLSIDAEKNSTNNFIYIAGGFLALKGDVGTDVSRLINAGKIKIWQRAGDGSFLWETAVTGDLLVRYCAEAGPAKYSTSSVKFAGYDNLAGYTIITGGSIVATEDVTLSEDDVPVVRRVSFPDDNQANYSVSLSIGYPYGYWYASSWYWYDFYPDPFFYDWMWPYHYGYYPPNVRWDYRRPQPDRRSDRVRGPQGRPGQDNRPGQDHRPDRNRKPDRDRGPVQNQPPAPDNRPEPDRRPAPDPGHGQNQDQGQPQNQDQQQGPGGGDRGGRGGRR